MVQPPQTVKQQLIQFIGSIVDYELDNACVSRQLDYLNNRPYDVLESWFDINYRSMMTKEINFDTLVDNLKEGYVFEIITESKLGAV